MDAFDDLTLTFNFNEPIVDTFTLYLNEKKMKPQATILPKAESQLPKSVELPKASKGRKAKAKK